MEKNIIVEDYCSYEVAKLLKEKGFNEICDHYIDCHWEEDGVLQHTPSRSSDLMFGYMCPTHQMAMKWLRAKRIIITVNIAIDYVNPIYWGEITDLDNLTDGRYMLRCSPTYEQAVEAALKLALENLI